MASSTDSGRFYNYPEVRQGPSVPYQNETQSIPVLRGIPLAIGAALIQNIGPLQSFLWRDAKFSVIHDIPHLDAYSPRYDPTVIPITSSSSSPAAAAAASHPAPRPSPTTYYTSADYRAQYLSGKITPLAVIETLLPLIRRDIKPPGKHSTAFLESQAEIVRAAAEASTERYKRGTSLGPLDGVPVAVKDEVHLSGYKRTLGTNGLDFSEGKKDVTSWCVRKWEEAGGIVIGKTTMHELGLDTNNNNPNHGTPRNPHNPQFYCGGSSGGSGYAVGSGLVPIALGADGGGSIRIPASFCGIWGLKPSHRRVSGAPTVGLAESVGVYGPMAASIDDLALAYRVMATPTPAAEDPVAALFPDPSSAAGGVTKIRAKTKTIGIVRDWIDRAEPAVRTVFDTALAYCRDTLSYKVVDITIPYLPEGQRAHVLTIMAEIASGVTPAQIGRLAAPNKVLVSLGAHQIKARDLIAAQRLRNLLMSHLAHLFTTYPGLIILTPTTPLPGWKIEHDGDLSHGLSDGKASVRNMEYAWLANFVGCPAISCPAGWVSDESHMPVGIMGMGEWGSEEDLIDFARDAEPVLYLDAVQPLSRKGENVNAVSGSAIAAGQGKGLRVPNGPKANWVDVFAETKSLGAMSG